MNIEPADRLDQLEAGAHRPLGVVLVRLRPAEVGEHAVAQVFCNVAVEAADHLRARRLVRAHDFTQVLGVEPRRQRGRPNEIAEQHRQLAALRCARRRLGFSLRAAVRPSELGDRAQELLAVAEREPELLQVLVGQVRQDLAVNVVLGKDRPVPAEPQPFEPLVDVAHGRAPPPGGLAIQALRLRAYLWARPQLKR